MAWIRPGDFFLDIGETHTRIGINMPSQKYLKHPAFHTWLLGYDSCSTIKFQWEWDFAVKFPESNWHPW